MAENGMNRIGPADDEELARQLAEKRQAMAALEKEVKALEKEVKRRLSSKQERKNEKGKKAIAAAVAAAVAEGAAEGGTTAGEGAAAGNDGDGEDEPFFTEVKQLEEILRSFSVKAGGAHCKRAGLWLLVKTRKPESRSKLRSMGILHLADVLGRDDFDAVELLAKAWTTRNKELRQSGSKALGVTVYRANDVQGYLNGKYLMFGSHPPEDSVTVLGQLRQGLYADSSSSSSSSSTPPTQPPSVTESSNKRLRRAPKKQLLGISIGDHEGDDALLTAIEHVKEGESARKKRTRRSTDPAEEEEEEEEEERPKYRNSKGKFLSSKQHSAAHDLLCLRNT